MNLFTSSSPNRDYPVEEKLYTGYMKDENIITVLGNSATAGISARYLKVLEEIRNHFATADSLTIYFYLMKISVPAILQLYKVLQELSNQAQAGHEVKVYWLTEEKEGKLSEIGKGLKSTFKVDFSLSVI